MTMLSETTCCGLDEIDGLENTPEATLIAVCESKYPPRDDWGFDEADRQAYILFTDVVKRGKGVALAQYIKKNKLGLIVETRQRKNPNSGNIIKAWIWSPAERALKRWYKEQ